MYGSKIAIYNNLSLYNLLKELKLDLSISSIGSNKENLDEFVKKNPNSLIISTDKINKLNNVLILNKSSSLVMTPECCPKAAKKPLDLI